MRSKCTGVIRTPGNFPNMEERKYLTEQELAQLLKVIASPRDKAIFTVAYYRGLRASEVGKLPYSAFDQKSGRLYVKRLKSVWWMTRSTEANRDLRLARAGSIAETLFIQMIMGDDRAIAATYAGGACLHRRSS